MTWLLYIFGAYLAGCYLWALYLVVRLYTGKRLRVLLFGDRGAKRAARRTTHATPATPYSTVEPAARRKAAA